MEHPSVTTNSSKNDWKKNAGFVQLLKEVVNHNLVEFHCILHQGSLYAKTSLKLLENIMPLVTKIVNFIVAHALNKHQFTN